MSLAEISGLIPHSDATPSLIERLISTSPVLLFSVVLLVPHRLFSQGMRYKVLLACYVIFVTAITYYAAHSVLLYISGVTSWYIILESTLLLLVPLSNGFALWYANKYPSLIT